MIKIEFIIFLLKRVEPNISSEVVNDDNIILEPINR